MQQGKIILSCGHEDKAKPKGWGLLYEEWSGLHPTLASAQFCTKCFADYVLKFPSSCWTLDMYETAKEEVYGQTR